jgi:carbon storage regulator
MLALSRRIGEAIRIGDDLILEVLDIGRHTVMLELQRPDPDFDRPQWLVVDRRVGESFQATEGICVSVSDVNGSLVRLGIDAPSSVKIVRAELDALPIEQRGGHRGDPADGD